MSDVFSSVFRRLCCDHPPSPEVDQYARQPPLFHLPMEKSADSQWPEQPTTTLTSKNIVIIIIVTVTITLAIVIITIVTSVITIIIITIVIIIVTIARPTLKSLSFNIVLIVPLNAEVASHYLIPTTWIHCS